MPDMSMCPGRNCPDRIECYRYMAISTYIWQSHGNFDELREEDKCEYFWEIGDRRIRKEAKDE